jgi:hypothetical protein
MKKIIVLFLISLFIVNPASFANEDTHRKTALKLLEITETKKMFDQMKVSYQGLISQYISAVDMPPEASKDFEVMKQDILKMADTIWSWEEMKEIYIDIFINVYTEDEIKELIAFYESPLGQKVIAKSPELMQESVQKSQQLFQDKLPEYQKILNKRVEELQAKYSK